MNPRTTCQDGLAPCLLGLAQAIISIRLVTFSSSSPHVLKTPINLKGARKWPMRCKLTQTTTILPRNMHLPSYVVLIEWANSHLATFVQLWHLSLAMHVVWARLWSNESTKLALTILFNDAQCRTPPKPLSYESPLRTWRHSRFDDEFRWTPLAIYSRWSIHCSEI